MLLERDALESKNYQLMLIDEAVQKAISSKRLKTYLPNQERVSLPEWDKETLSFFYP